MLIKKIKEKICKNVECGKMYLPITTLQRACSYPCEAKVRAQKKVEKANRNEVNGRQRKDTLMKSAVTICHAYIRKRDEGKNCISCGAKWNKTFQAGHLFSCGGHSSVKFDEENIHGQCFKCNSGSNFDSGKYIEEFERRYSPEEFEALRSRAYETKKWEEKDLMDVISEYRLKLKKLTDEKNN